MEQLFLRAGLLLFRFRIKVDRTTELLYEPTKPSCAASSIPGGFGAVGGVDLLRMILMWVVTVLELMKSSSANSVG